MGVGHLLLKHVSQVASWSQTGMENNKHLTPPARKSSWYWCVTPLIYVWLNYGQDWGFARNEMINFFRRHISLRRRSVLWPWYICALVPRRISRKISRKSELSADFMRFGLFPSFLASLECSYVILPQPCALLCIVCINENVFFFLSYHKSSNTPNERNPFISDF